VGLPPRYLHVYSEIQSMSQTALKITAKIKPQNAMPHITGTSEVGPTVTSREKEGKNSQQL